MREIKFRGKCLDSGTWLCGSLFDRIWRKSSDGSRVCYIFNDSMIDDDNGGGGSWEDFADVAEQYEVDPATVGQYTGLKDGDGKEIYEGDIVNDVERINGSVYSQQYVIEYSERHCGFVGVAAQRLLTPSCFDDVKVIGTIHDNPETLNLKTF